MMLVTDVYCFGIANAMPRPTIMEIAVTRASRWRRFQSICVRWAHRGHGTDWRVSSLSRVAEEPFGVMWPSSIAMGVPTSDMARSLAFQPLDQRCRRFGE